MRGMGGAAEEALHGGTGKKTEMWRRIGDSEETELIPRICANVSIEGDETRKYATHGGGGGNTSPGGDKIRRTNVARI